MVIRQSILSIQILFSIIGICISRLIINKICKYIAEETQEKNIDGLGNFIDYFHETDYLIKIESHTLKWTSIFNLLTGIIFIGFAYLCFPELYTIIFFAISIDQLYYSAENFYNFIKKE